ncbi:hypothetical protein BGZ61DRAFT_440548 [Ilyonectria robusta]|uniref:uncharacterized protein n=1 Tax=Ilyonectria robusta TaxID=1079257 RepID=UPI001E8D91D1|nr:uncharacterized protein BGZ61DRAFT_440548 [Ilyonectria robusta]KAH8735603.1 hypothetical protein BGZ61DRAFT_440548 [Ilyonectria robusta]
MGRCGRDWDWEGRCWALLGANACRHRLVTLMVLVSGGNENLCLANRGYLAIPLLCKASSADNRLSRTRVTDDRFW